MREPARIAANAAIIGERPTGLGFYALHLLEALAGLGERLTVFTSRPDLFSSMPAEVRPAPAAARPERGASGHLTRLLWVQSGLRVGVSRARAGLLLNLMPEGLLFPSIPQLTVVHDLLPLRYPAEYPRQQYYFRHYVPAVLRCSRGVIVISESTRRDVLRFYPDVRPEKVHVVLSGYDSRRFAAEPLDEARGDDRYALYLGNVMPHKNLERLVEAFALVARRTPCRLVLRGTGRPVHVARLRGRIADLGIESRVDWQPYASAEDIGALYRRARVLVLPSIYEGFGLTALEAMACGTPVVASNTSSIPEVVGDAALTVDPLDASAIAEAMTRVLTDDVLAKDLRARGVARAGAFSWEKTARAVQAVMREVAAA